MKPAFLILLLLLPVLLPAQNKRVNAEGRWEVSRDITPARAEQFALQEAKREALREAGIPEEVLSASLHIQMADSLYFSDINTEISTLQLNGQVRVISQQLSDSYDPATGRITKVAAISAEVSPLPQRDASFSFTCTGLKNSYSSEESVRFSIRPFQSCYLYLFIFDPSGGTLLFPGYYEQANRLQPDRSYDFPRNSLVVYSIEKSDHSVTYEQNILLAVISKEHLPFSGPVTVRSVFDWLYHIPADKRNEQYFSFLVE